MPATWIIRTSCFSHRMVTIMTKDTESASTSKRLSLFVVGIFLFGKSMASAADETCTMNYVVELGLTSDCVFDRAMLPMLTLQTSHALQASALNPDINEIRRLNGQDSSDAAAYTYGDFDGDGDEDFFVAPSFYTEESTPVEIYFNDGDGNFSLDNSFFQGSIPELVHPRKAITGDFNGDGRLDIFVAGHGYDKPPFPGEAPVLLLSTENGLRQVDGLDHLVGFLHGAASADIDNDGDLDIFVTDITNGPFFLINDGEGVFSHTVDVLPSEINAQAIFTTELVDVDSDGYPDLLVGGHENQEDGKAPTAIYWGNATGQYDGSRKTILPEVNGQGIIVDIDAGDLDGDGNVEIVVNRTAEEPFYSGFYIQIISGAENRAFTDTSGQSIDYGAKETGNWIAWLRLVDLNGDGYLDIAVDDPGDAGLEYSWLNDGSGRLELVKQVYPPFLHDWIQITDGSGLTDTQVRDLMDALVRTSDTIVHMDTVSSPVTTASNNVEFDVLQSSVGVTFQQIHGTEDVSLTIGFRDMGSESYLEYGGWLEHSMFALIVSDLDSGFQADAYSLGAATGTNPDTGSATWTGSVIGVDTHVIGRGRVLRGDAAINVDFADEDVDVAFTFLRYHLEGNITRSDMTWDDLPLNAGEFGSDTIHGVFYGPNHEEVGGVFRRDGVLGAFGGTRE